jgi:hypothetical protein
LNGSFWYLLAERARGRVGLEDEGRVGLCSIAL